MNLAYLLDVIPAKAGISMASSAERDPGSARLRRLAGMTADIGVRRR
ncbi:hypothetical protein AB4Z01_19040 [Inquilinus sp. YAF38]